MLSAPSASNALWWQPGKYMAAGWWQNLALEVWQPAYLAHPTLRPLLDRLIAQRLGHEGQPPVVEGYIARLLADVRWRDALCLGLGLWALQCPDYLLLRPYRQALEPGLSWQQQAQLLALFPAWCRNEAAVTPDVLPQIACQTGAAWLAKASEPALSLCRLFWPPSKLTAPGQPVRPVLEKLARWL